MKKTSKKYIARAIREIVAKRAKGQCEYCLKFEFLARTSFQVDHIIAEQHDGETTLENLAFACRYCNGFKGTNLVTKLPGVEEFISLYNPRKAAWSQHFSLEETGLIVGKTLVGEATLKLLQINTVENLITRSRMIETGLLVPV